MRLIHITDEISKVCKIKEGDTSPWTKHRSEGMCWVSEIVALYSSRNTIYLGCEVSGIYCNCPLATLRLEKVNHIEYFKRERGDRKAMRDNQIREAEEGKESKHVGLSGNCQKG